MSGRNPILNILMNCSTTLTTIPDEYFSKVDMVVVDDVLDQIERIISGKRLMRARDDEEDSSNTGYEDDIISVSTPARRTSSTRPDDCNDDNTEEAHSVKNNKDRLLYSDKWQGRLQSVEDTFHRPFVDDLHHDIITSPSITAEDMSNNNTTTADEVDDSLNEDDYDDGWDSDPYEWEEEQEVYKVRFQDILDALHTLSDYHLAQLVNRVANIRPHLLQNHPLRLLEEHRATEHQSDLRRQGSSSTFNDDDDMIQASSPGEMTTTTTCYCC